MEGINIKKVVYDREMIAERVNELGKKITEDYKDRPPVVIGVINGALYFFSDLTRAIDLPILVDTMGFANIPDTTSRTGRVKITKDIDVDIEGREVIIVEDVIRTGLTTAYLISNLELRKPAGIRVCTLLLNPDRLLLNLPIDYTGFNIKDEWLLGYGLDKKGIGRNIPDIVAVDQ